MFWSSGKLTGSQTSGQAFQALSAFWSSGKLTGSRTCCCKSLLAFLFLSNGDRLVTNLGVRRERRVGASTSRSRRDFPQRFQLVSLRWGFLGVDLRMLTGRTVFADDRCDRQATR